MPPVNVPYYVIHNVWMLAKQGILYGYIRLYCLCLLLDIFFFSVFFHHSGDSSLWKGCYQSAFIQSITIRCISWCPHIDFLHLHLWTHLHLKPLYSEQTLWTCLSPICNGSIQQDWLIKYSLLCGPFLERNNGCVFSLMPLAPLVCLTSVSFLELGLLARTFKNTSVFGSFCIMWTFVHSIGEFHHITATVQACVQFTIV